ncbi:MAG: hypothetical protein KJZ73_06145 [Pseudorhodoplanes sp.]|nr:hypothetical protein [Pseudorhodoplanes sp.]MCL4710811.1 hypothetical protein [Pseudorhodoplanes sp.]
MKNQRDAGLRTLCASLVAACPFYLTNGASAQDTSAWTTVLDFETRYFSWERTKGNWPGQPRQNGTQSYTPFSLQTTGTPADNWKFEFLARGGYVGTTRSALPFAPPFGVPYSTGTVATATDTLLTGTVTYLGFSGWQPFYTLSLNLPTGETVLLGKKGIARTDPDLVDIPAFGEGFNHEHTVGANVPITSDIVASFSVGYTEKGAYNREVGDISTLNGAVLPFDRVEHGNTTAFSANVAGNVGQLGFYVSGAVTLSEPDRVNSVDVFKSGRNYFLAGNLTWRWDEMWTSAVTASYVHTDKLYLADPTSGALLLEPFNSNSNLVRVEFAQTLAWQSFTFSGNVAYMRRDANEYVPTAQSFVPAKTKWSVGGGVKYAANSRWTLSARAERFWIDEYPKPDFDPFIGFVSGLPMSYVGTMIAAGVTMTF